jgi:hypothetical protein
MPSTGLGRPGYGFLVLAPGPPCPVDGRLTFDIQKDVFRRSSLTSSHFALVASSVARLHVGQLQFVVSRLEGGGWQSAAIATPLDPAGCSGCQVTAQLYCAADVDVSLSTASLCPADDSILCGCHRLFRNRSRNICVMRIIINNPTDINIETSKAKNKNKTCTTTRIDPKSRNK